MNTARRIRLANDVAELSARIAVALEGGFAGHIEAHISGLPVAAGGGDGGGRRQVVWCWNHQRPVSACHADDELCSGDPVEIRDSMAEAACTPDRARQDLAALDRDLERMGNTLERVVRLLGGYTPRSASDRERAESQGGADGCWSCARLPNPHHPGEQRWEPGTRRVIVDDEGRDLCSWCDKWHRKTGTLPPKDILERHHRGERIRLPVDA